jgi:hypothetical protein
MRNVLKIAIVAALLSPLTIIIAAQNQPLAFEVASVKPNDSTGGSYYVGCYTPASTLNLIPKGMCIARGATLRAIIAEANGFTTFESRDNLKGGQAGLAAIDTTLKARPRTSIQRPTNCARCSAIYLQSGSS